MSETFLRKFNGGPDPGIKGVQGKWPLPEEFVYIEGKYVKTNESQLPGPASHVVRGAEYRWVPLFSDN